jgi:hypothetical protein
VKQPWVYEQPIRRDREIMAVFNFADARGLVVGVAIPAHLAAKSIRDDSSARRAIACFMRAARKYPLVP